MDSYKVILIEEWDGIIGTWVSFDDVEYDSIHQAREAIEIAKSRVDNPRFRIRTEIIEEA